VLLPNDLHVDVLVVVSVHCSNRALVPEPEIDGISGLFEGDTCPRDIRRHVREESVVFFAQIVVLYLSVSGKCR
jgi:hypothetical protein